MSLACEFMMDSYQQALFQVKSIFSHEKKKFIAIFLSFFFKHINMGFFLFYMRQCLDLTMNYFQKLFSESETIIKSLIFI